MNQGCSHSSISGLVLAVFAWIVSATEWSVWYEKIPIQCMHTSRKPQTLFCQGCWHFTCESAELPRLFRLCFCTLCTVSACAFQCLHKTVLKNGSSGVDINHKPNPSRGTKCAGSHFYQNSFPHLWFCLQEDSKYIICLTVLIKNSHILHNKVRSQWTLETSFQRGILSTVIVAWIL